MPAGGTSKDTVAPITLKVGGGALDPRDGARLVSVTVRNSLLAPDVADVAVADPERRFITGTGFKIGAEIEVLAGGPDDPNAATIFKGAIATLQPEYSDGVTARFRAYDRSLRLTRGRRTRVWQNVKVTDAMAAVLQGHGFSAQVSQSFTVQDWLQQTEESDFDFLWRLARSLDYVMIIDGTVAKIGPLGEIATGGPELEWGSGEMSRRLFEFHPTVTAAQVTETVHVVAHDPKTDEQWEKQHQTFSEQMLVKSKAAADVKSGGTDIYGGSIFRVSTTARKQDEVNARAKSIASRLLQTCAEATGLAEGQPGLKAGVRVEVKNADQFTGSYVITETRHVYRGGSGYRTHFTCSAGAGRSLGDLTGAPGANGHGDFGRQLVLAKVTNNDDPDKMGRVRVAFATIREEKSPNAEGWWARLTSPSTGDKRGLLMLPQVGEEVLVGFEYGDTANPMVLGSLWNGKALPGEDLISGKDGSFVLRSDKQINMKAEKEIEVTAGKDMKVTVGGKMESKTTGDFTDEVTGKRAVKSTGPTTIESTGQMKIASKAPMEISAPVISVKADAKLELSAPMVNITGSTMVVIDGGLIKLG